VLPAADVEVYYDIEGLPDDGFNYLIGAAVARDGSLECRSFWASDRPEQATAFSQFADFVAGLPGCKLFHFGRYDSDALSQVQEELNLDKRDRLEWILAESTNVLTVVHSHVYFPVYSNSLKDIAAFLGFQWSDADASGLLSMEWREMWDLSRDPSLRERLIRYNREDCLALKHVCDFDRRAVVSVTNPGTPNPSEPGTPRVQPKERAGLSIRPETNAQHGLPVRKLNGSRSDFVQSPIWGSVVSRRGRRTLELANVNAIKDFGRPPFLLGFDLNQARLFGIRRKL
jgi:hypothetical protein